MMTAHEGDGGTPYEPEGGTSAAHEPTGQDAASESTETQPDEPAETTPAAQADPDDARPTYAKYRPGKVAVHPASRPEAGESIPAAVPVDELPEQYAKAAGRGKLFLYSATFHGIVMASVAGFMWWLTDRYSLGNTPAVVATIVVTLLFGLRIIRGSQLTAETEVRSHLAELVIEAVSDRVAGALYPHEKVRWEARQHPLSIVAVGISRLMRTKRRRKIVSCYLLAVSVTLLAIRWYQSQGDPAGFVPTLASLLGLLVLAIPGYLAYICQEWRLNRYAITNLRLVGVVGVFKKSAGSMPTARFTDVKVNTSVVANILAWLRIIKVPYAIWDVESAGQDQALKFLFFVKEGYEVAAVFGLGKIS